MASYTSSQSGNWSDVATWGGGGYPQASDNATITGYTVTMTANVAVTNITFGANGILTTGNYAITMSGVFNQANTTSRCNAGTSTITVNGDGAFTANGTQDGTQYNNATIILNGVNTLTYGNNASYWANGFKNLTCGQGGQKTTIANHFTIRTTLTVGSGILDGSAYVIYFLGATPVVVDNTNAPYSRISISTIALYGTNQTIPALVNGYDCSIVSGVTGTVVTQTGDVTINFPKALSLQTYATNQSITWKTDGYNLTIGGNLYIGFGSDSGLKKLDATHNGARTSTITVSGNWLNYGNGTAPSQFVADNSTVIFNATASGKTITSGANAASYPFNNITFNGVNGVWTLQDALFVSGTYTRTNGSLLSLSNRRKRIISMAA